MRDVLVAFACAGAFTAVAVAAAHPSTRRMQRTTAPPGARPGSPG